MNQLNIEWRHLDVDGDTCLRCSETGKTLKQVVEELRRLLARKGVSLRFTERRLPPSQLEQSNLILLNGTPLEDVLEGAKASESCCRSCACLTGREAYCRTVEYQGRVYEEIPEDLIRLAVATVLGLE